MQHLMGLCESVAQELHAMRLLWEERLRPIMQVGALLVRLSGLATRVCVLLVLEAAAWVALYTGLLYRQRRSLDSKVVLITGTSFAFHARLLSLLFRAICISLHFSCYRFLFVFLIWASPCRCPLVKCSNAISNMPINYQVPNLSGM